MNLFTRSVGAGGAVNMDSCSGAAGSQTWLVKAVAGAADGSVTIATGDGKLNFTTVHTTDPLRGGFIPRFNPIVLDELLPRVPHPIVAESRLRVIPLR